MSNKEYLIYEKEDLVAVADAVRAKTGSSETYLVSELPAAINNIVGGGSEEMGLLLSSHLENKSNPHNVTAEQVGAVPKERTINGKALTANITLSASDVGADVNGAALAVQSSLNTHTTNKSNPHEVSLTQLGINATADELNYVSGVTSNIQTQINEIANASSKNIWYGTCDEAANSVTRNVTTTTGDFKLETGNIVCVYFVNAMSAQSIMLNVDGTGSKTTSSVSTGDWVAGTVVSFVYDASKGHFKRLNWTKASTSNTGVVKLSSSTSSTSTSMAATPSAVKEAYDLANTAYTQAEGKVANLSDLGVTATATELNYVDGVTSNLQTQLDNKLSLTGGSMSGDISFNNNTGIFSKDTTDTHRALLRLSTANNLLLGESGITGYICVYQNLNPSTTFDKQLTLGTSSQRWKNLYLSDSISDGTNTATIQEIGKLSGVTFNIQTQLNNKVNASDLTAITIAEIDEICGASITPASEVEL